MFQFGVRVSYIQLAPMDVGGEQRGMHFYTLNGKQGTVSVLTIFGGYKLKLGDKF